jgi:hypothetical protein
MLIFATTNKNKKRINLEYLLILTSLHMWYQQLR